MKAYILMEWSDDAHRYIPNITEVSFRPFLSTPIGYGNRVIYEDYQEEISITGDLFVITESKEVFGVYYTEELAVEAIEKQKENLAKNYPSIAGQYSYEYQTYKVVF